MDTHILIELTFFYIHTYNMLDTLDTLTTSKLKSLCKKKQIPGYSKLNKKALIIHIKTHMIERMICDGLTQLNRVK